VAEHYHVVQTFPSNRADQPLHIGSQSLNQPARLRGSRLRVLFVFLVMEHGRRRVLPFGILAKDKPRGASYFETIAAPSHIRTSSTLHRFPFLSRR